ncbi:MAG: cytochrome c [Leeuwenhoekiella sp.]
MKIIITLITAVIIMSLYAFNQTSNYTFSSGQDYENRHIQDTTLKNSMKRGEVLYADFCMQCHMTDGKGVEKTYPPLAQSDYLSEHKNAIKAVKFGLNGEILVNGIKYSGAMADLGLYDDEIADVMNYILNSWNNTSEEIITPELVKQIDK